MKADRYLFDGSHPCALRKLPCDNKDDHVKKEDILAKTAENLEKMAALQDAFYADGREGLVIILQALDAAGKDSTIKHVMGGLNPQGVQVTSFKQPTSEELHHDFLWRVNKALPPRGSIAIFNRSYYEDVLVVQVHDLQKTYQMAPRVLEDSKKDFFEKRFLERIDRPEKNWKFSCSDLKERMRFDEYLDTFDEVITATATKHSPWYAIPADQKWYTRYLVSEIVLDALQKSCHEYPVLSDDAKAELLNCKAALEQE